MNFLMIILAGIGLFFVMLIILIIILFIISSKKEEPLNETTEKKIIDIHVRRSTDTSQNFDEELEDSEFSEYSANPYEVKEEKDNLAYKKIRIIAGKEDALKKVQEKLKKLRQLRITLYDENSDEFSEDYDRVDKMIHELEVIESELIKDIEKLTRETV